MDDEHLDGDAPDAHVVADGQTAETNGGCQILHERSSSVERWDSKVTVLILSLFFLDIKSDAGTPVQEICNPLEVLRGPTARGHRRGPDADATWRKRRGVAMDRVAIQRDGRSFTHLLHLGPRQSVWTKIPEHQVIVSTATGEPVPLGNQDSAKVPALDTTALEYSTNSGVFTSSNCAAKAPIWWL